MSKKRAVYSALIYSGIFGFSFLFTKLTLAQVDSVFHLLALRFMIAFVVMSLLIKTKSAKIDYKGKPHIRKLLLLSLIQPVIYFTFETLGIAVLTSSQAGIMIACIPVFVLLFARITLKEKTTAYQNFFITLSVAGAVVLNAGNMNIGDIRGVIFLFLAVISAAAYSVLSRSLSYVYSSFEITYAMITTGAVCFNITAVIMHVSNGDMNTYLAPFTDIKALGGIVYLGLASSVAAFFLLNYTLSKLEASKASVFANLTTVIAAAAGAIFLKEIIGSNHIVGGLMILTGVYMSGKRTIKTNQ